MHGKLIKSAKNFLNTPLQKCFQKPSPRPSPRHPLWRKNLCNVCSCTVLLSISSRHVSILGQHGGFYLRTKSRSHSYFRSGRPSSNYLLKYKFSREILIIKVSQNLKKLQKYYSSPRLIKPPVNKATLIKPRLIKPLFFGPEFRFTS